MVVSILVVDDETDVAELFRQHFRREARQGIYVLHFACSGQEALDKLAAGIEPPPMVILSDINMPVMLVTAYGDDERRRLSGEYGAAEFITKPVDFDLLKTQLRDLSEAAD